MPKREAALRIAWGFHPATPARQYNTPSTSSSSRPQVPIIRRVEHPSRIQYLSVVELRHSRGHAHIQLVRVCRTQRKPATQGSRRQSCRPKAVVVKAAAARISICFRQTGASAQRVQKGVGVPIAVSRRRSPLMLLVSATPSPSPLFSSPSMSALGINGGAALRGASSRAQVLFTPAHPRTEERKDASVHPPAQNNTRTHSELQRVPNAAVCVAGLKRCVSNPCFVPKRAQCSRHHRRPVRPRVPV